MAVDPVRSVRFVAGERERPCHRDTVLVDEHFVRANQQCVEHRAIVSLTRAEVEVQRMPLDITQDVDLRTPSPT